jgi:hypothetical protein
LDCQIDQNGLLYHFLEVKLDVLAGLRCFDHPVMGTSSSKIQLLVDVSIEAAIFDRAAGYFSLDQFPWNLAKTASSFGRWAVHRYAWT